MISQLQRKFKLTTLLSVLLLLSFKTQATQIDTSKGCYKLKISGGIIDTDQCTSTSVQVSKINCKTRNLEKSKRLMAKLSKCTDNSSLGIVKWNKEKIHFKAKRSSKMGLEIWSLSSLASSYSNIVKKSKTKIKPLPEKRTKKTKVKMTTLAAKSKDSEPTKSTNSVKFYFDSYYAVNLNSPKSAADTNVAEQENSFRLNDTQNNELHLGAINLNFTHKRNNISSTIEISEGASYSKLRNLPDGAYSDAPLVSQAFVKYNTDLWGIIATAGRIKSPLTNALSNAGARPHYSYDLVDTLFVPKYINAVNLDKAYSKNFSSNLTVFNGWSKHNSGNSSMALNLQSKYSSNNNYSIIFDVYSDKQVKSGQEVDALAFQGRGTIKFLSSNEFNLRLFYQKSTNDPLNTNATKSTSSVLTAGYKYQFENLDALSARIDFLQSELDLSHNNGIGSDFSSYTLSYIKQFDKNLTGFAEARMDQANSELFKTDSANSSANQLTLLFAFSYNFNKEWQ